MDPRAKRGRGVSNHSRKRDWFTLFLLASATCWVLFHIAQGSHVLDRLSAAGVGIGGFLPYSRTPGVKLGSAAAFAAATARSAAAAGGGAELIRPALIRWTPLPQVDPADIPLPRWALPDSTDPDGHEAAILQAQALEEVLSRSVELEGLEPEQELEKEQEHVHRELREDEGPVLEAGRAGAEGVAAASGVAERGSVDMAHGEGEGEGDANGDGGGDGAVMEEPGLGLNAEIGGLASAESGDGEALAANGLGEGEKADDVAEREARYTQHTARPLAASRVERCMRNDEVKAASTSKAEVGAERQAAHPLPRLPPHAQKKSPPRAHAHNPPPHSKKGEAKEGRGHGEKGKAHGKPHQPPASAKHFHLGGTKIDHLLAEKVDVALSQSILDTGAAIACGGKPIMELKDLKKVAASHPALRQGLPQGLPHDDVFVTAAAGPGARTLGTCAVVGNSGALLGSGLGQVIDGHDSVLRFNAAPTAGFATDVGSKTTIRMQNVDTLGWAEPQDAVLIFSARSAKDFARFADHQLAADKSPAASKAVQLVFNPAFWCHTWEWVGRHKTKPSSGLAGVALALRHCKHPVDMFGFEHNASRFHYFNELPEQVTTKEVYTYHPLREEADLYLQLQERGLVRAVRAKEGHLREGQE